MQHYVAFVRAINVAGHARVRMSDVRDAFATAGCRKVRTYIQSGNVIFESPAREAAAIFRKVQRTLRHALDEEPDIVWRTLREIEELVGTAPFKDVEAGSAVKLYVAFLSQRPRNKPKFPFASSKEGLERVLWLSEQFHRERVRDLGHHSKLVNRHQDRRARAN